MAREVSAKKLLGQEACVGGTLCGHQRLTSQRQRTGPGMAMPPCSHRLDPDAPSGLGVTQWFHPSQGTCAPPPLLSLSPPGPNLCVHASPTPPPPRYTPWDRWLQPAPILGDRIPRVGLLGGAKCTRLHLLASTAAWAQGQGNKESEGDSGNNGAAREPWTTSFPKGCREEEGAALRQARGT